MLIAVAMIGRVATAGAQLAANRLADSLRVAIEAAADRGELSAVDSTITLADRALAAFPDSPILLHYRAYALYRAATIALGGAGASDARTYLDKARGVLEPLVEHPTIPESYALLASVYGLQIGVSRVPMIAGMKLGPKASHWMDRAIAEAPRNPRVWLMKGIGDFHTPGMMGGGLGRAERDLKQALELFADDRPAPPLPAWGLADLHVWLGQVYAGQKKTDAARAEYHAALALQPRNAWITMVLLPAVDRIGR